MDADDERWQGLVGLPFGPEGRSFPLPVNAATIGHWLDVFGITDPVFTDDGAAVAAGRAGIVAPATMLNTWTIRSYGAAIGAHLGGGDGAGDEVLTGLRAELGATGILASDMSQRYDRELVPGEVITRADSVDAVSPRRTTAVGSGWFVGYRAVFTDASGLRVGEQAACVLYYRPAESPRTGPARSLDQPGEPVARLVVPVTRSLVVNGAIATRDFNPVHHDPEFARDRGVDDVFFNIYSHLALCERLAGEWAGSGARLLKAGVRLLLPALPGDELVYQAHVDPADPKRLQIVAASSRGVHLRGEVEMSR